MNNFPLRRFPLFMLLLLSCVTCVQAQSGRRSTTTPTTPSVSGTKPVEKVTKPVAKISLLLGVENRSPFLNIPYYLSDTVLENCVQRLNDSGDVVPHTVGRGMERADAVRRAKEEKEAYVVWLQVESDVVDSGRQQKEGPDELYVRYTIFEPQTGKVRQSGRTHKQIYKTGRGGVSTPTSTRNGPLYSEYALKQAAREAAERILEAFEAKVQNDPW
ncbi:MAG: hypothetical protein AABM67_17645 [Acidobacteriota bacterium]